MTPAPVVNRQGYELLEYSAVDEQQLMATEPSVSSAFVLAHSRTGVLLVFNRWRSCWELPGGLLEADEAPRDCALRELREESSQVPDDLNLHGLMRIRYRPEDRIFYSALYTCRIDELRPFEANAETDQLTVWDLTSDIGYIEEISRILAEEYGSK